MHFLLWHFKAAVKNAGGNKNLFMSNNYGILGTSHTFYSVSGFSCRGCVNTSECTVTQQVLCRLSMLGEGKRTGSANVFDDSKWQ